MAVKTGNCFFISTKPLSNSWLTASTFSIDSLCKNLKAHKVNIVAPLVTALDPNGVPTTDGSFKFTEAERQGLKNWCTIAHANGMKVAGWIWDFWQFDHSQGMHYSSVTTRTNTLNVFRDFLSLGCDWVLDDIEHGEGDGSGGWIEFKNYLIDQIGADRMWMELWNWDMNGQTEEIRALRPGIIVSAMMYNGGPYANGFVVAWNKVYADAANATGKTYIPNIGYTLSMSGNLGAMTSAPESERSLYGGILYWFYWEGNDLSGWDASNLPAYYFSEGPVTCGVGYHLDPATNTCVKDEPEPEGRFLLACFGIFGLLLMIVLLSGEKLE